MFKKYENGPSVKTVTENYLISESTIQRIIERFQRRDEDQREEKCRSSSYLQKNYWYTSFCKDKIVRVATESQTCETITENRIRVNNCKRWLVFRFCFSYINATTSFDCISKLLKKLRTRLVFCGVSNDAHINF